MSEDKLPSKLEFLEGEAIHKPFIKGRPLDDCHNVASYAIGAEGHGLVQNGTHGVRCRCSDHCEELHEIASDAPFYNLAPSYDIAKEMVRRWNLYGQQAPENNWHSRMKAVLNEPVGNGTASDLVAQALLATLEHMGSSAERCTGVEGDICVACRTVLNGLFLYGKKNVLEDETDQDLPVRGEV